MKIRTRSQVIVAACLVFWGFVLPALSKDRAVESRWTATPVAVDASPSEWSEETLLTEEKAGVDFSFRNDSDYLYLLFIIKDREHLSTLESTGITIFFNAQGKKSKDLGIRFFKKKATAEELIQAFEKSGQELSEERKAELRSRQQYLLYECEWTGKKKALSADAQQGSPSLLPAFKSHAEGGKTVLEFRFPLSREGLASGVGAASGGSLKVGFEWGGLTEEMKARRIARTQTAAERSSQAEVQSQSHDISDSRGGLGGVGSLSDTSRGTPKKYYFWLDVKLAAGQRP